MERSTLDKAAIAEGRDACELAKKLFVEASAKYPASVTAQGAFIAGSCRHLNQDPFFLRSFLINDRNAIRQITTLANNSHNSNPDAPVVDEGKVFNIVSSVYERATSYQRLGEAEIEKILDHYGVFGRRNEDMYREYAYSVLVKLDLAAYPDPYDLRKRPKIIPFSE